MNEKTVQVGAQDPELKNSPVAWEGEDEMEALRESVPGEPVCFFNDQAFEHGTIVGSGTVMLRCEYGIWVPAGPGDPQNP